MEEFANKLEKLIKNEFNLNVFGPNGCGKTTTIKKLLNFRLLSINPFFVKLHYFININEFFSSLQEYIKSCISNITNISNKNDKIFNIHNWNEFCDLMDYFKELKFSFYLILDEILDIETFLFFKKQISKLLAINRVYSHFKLLLISNFDMKKSELTNYFDFSVIFSLPFPSLTKNDIRKIIDENCNNLTYNSKQNSAIVDECIENFYYAFMNLNEYIYNIKKI
jgi:Cdc6-like AAA superfamily ATPase